MPVRTVIKIEVTERLHTMLMLTLLRHESIITKAINDARDRGDQVPQGWTDQQANYEELITGFKHE